MPLLVTALLDGLCTPITLGAGGLEVVGEDASGVGGAAASLLFAGWDNTEADLIVAAAEEGVLATAILPAAGMCGGS